MKNTYNEKEYFVAIKTPNETLKGVKKTREEATSELRRLLVSLKPANETNDITYLLHEIMQNQRVIKNYIKQTK